MSLIFFFTSSFHICLKFLVFQKQKVFQSLAFSMSQILYVSRHIHALYKCSHGVDTANSFFPANVSFASMILHQYNIVPSKDTQISSSSTLYLISTIHFEMHLRIYYVLPYFMKSHPFQSRLHSWPSNFPVFVNLRLISSSEQIYRTGVFTSPDV